jgi:adenosylcobinamide amidohydrolase
MVSHGHLGPGQGHRGALWWQFDAPRPAVSSASVGGGLLEVSWVLNVEVEHDYSRTDLEAHAAEVVRAIGLTGEGAAMFTAAPVERVTHVEEEGVRAWSTVGVTRPTWPADRTSAPTDAAGAPGTINTLVVVPRRLTSAGLVQAALSATEAKAQACVEAHVPGTGTASDAVVVVATAVGADDAEPFGGVRSTWGSRVSLAVHAAVCAGLAAPENRCR